MIDCKKLRACREAAGLTQTELAKRVGIAQTYYSRIERGISSASQETLQAIIQVLNVSIADIWDDGNTPSSMNRPAFQTQGIVIEHGIGKNRKRYILPPTPESYKFLETQMKEGEIDARLQAVINLWNSVDDATKDRLLTVFPAAKSRSRKISGDIPTTCNKRLIFTQKNRGGCVKTP